MNAHWLTDITGPLAIQGAGSASIAGQRPNPVLLEAQSDKSVVRNGGATRRTAEWFLIRADEASEAGNMSDCEALIGIHDCLLRCAGSPSRRCYHPQCPRCQGYLWRANRRHLEGHIRQGGAHAIATLTIACDDLQTGFTRLKKAFVALRRRQPWKGSILAGEAHLHVKRSDSGGARWNLHVHAIVPVREGLKLDKSALRRAWENALSAKGSVGSADYRPITRDPWVWSKSEKAMIHKAAAYVTARNVRKDLEALTGAEALEVRDFLKDRRRVITFGAWIAPRGASHTAPSPEVAP